MAVLMDVLAVAQRLNVGFTFNDSSTNVLLHLIGDAITQV
jgi:hypothetical protein